MAGLGRLMDKFRPDLILISGDLTQRARTHEFRLAKEFIRKLPAPVLVVPGNHDIPLYDVSSRCREIQALHQRRPPALVRG